jgi:hypothetical protein
MKLKVVIKNGNPRDPESGVFNAETREKLDNVVSIDIDHIGPNSGPVLAKVCTLCDLDIECEAEEAK